MPDRTDGLRIAVCICTAGRRPGPLDRLLDALARQTSINDVDRVIIVVADNTPTGACRHQVEQRVDQELLYCHEPRPGVSHARNASVEVALAADADFLAFIDDDEEPDPAWLATLIAAVRSFDSPIVAGPVFERGDQAIAAQVRTTPSGTLLDQAYTGNLMVSGAALRSLERASARGNGSDHGGWPFDHRFDRTGGEDVHLTRRLRAAGHRIIWCNEAIVYTDIEPADLSHRRIATRAFHGTLNAERARRSVDGRRLRRIPLGAAIAARGGLQLAVDFLGRRPIRASLERLTGGIGVMVGAAGVPVRGDWWAR